MYTESWPSLSLTDSNDCPVFFFFFPPLLTPGAFAVLNVLEVLLNVTDLECIPAMKICCWKELVAPGVEFLSEIAPTQAPTPPKSDGAALTRQYPLLTVRRINVKAGGKAPIFQKSLLK